VLPGEEEGRLQGLQMGTGWLLSKELRIGIV
jgi:hypothetical protein